MNDIRPFLRIDAPTARPMWLFAAALACGTSVVGQARAGCAPGSAGPQDYVCSGATPATSIANPASVAFVGGKATGAIAFAYAGGGDANFSLDQASSITASGTALTMVTTAGHVDMTTPLGANINGPITSLAGAAILAGAAGAGNDVNIVTGVGGVLKGATGGIVATADTTGDVDLTLGDKVTATTGAALKATTVDGAINITSTAALSGGVNAISATATGAGLISINAAGAVSASLGTAVSAVGGGAGDVTVFASAAVTGAAAGPSYGVYANSGTGNASVTPYGAVTAAGGVYASTGGAGAANVTAASPVVATKGDGISAFSVNGVATIQTGGSVAAANNGVVAAASGTGSVAIAIHGDVTGAGGVGVLAATDSGAIQIDMDKGAFVSGAAAGLRVQTNTGAAAVNNNANLSGAAGADAVAIDANLGAVSLNNAGTIVSTGNAINVQTGAALIRNTGTIDGVIASGATSGSTFNNNGVWVNAAGSTLSFLNSNGAITMGPTAAAPGLVTVTGDASFGPKSTLNMRITPIAIDAIAVGGQTTITGGIVNLTGSAAGLAKFATYTILSSVGGVTGNFSAVASNLGSFAGALTSDGANIYLTLLNRDFRALALNTNQLSVANAVWAGSALLATGAGSRLLTAVNNAPDAAVPAALTQMSGDGVVTGAANAALQAGHLFSSALADQSDIWLAGGDRDVNSITLTEPFAYAPTRTEGSKWPVSRQRSAPPPRQAFVQRTWRIWASGFGGQTKLGGDTGTGSASQTMSAVGGAMGVDYQLGQNMLMGAAAGYSSSAFSAGTSNVSGTTGGLHVGAYSSMKIGAFYANASLAYSGYSNATKRAIASIGGAAGETQSGNFSSEEVRTRIEVGRKMTMEAMAITPFAAVEVAHVHTHGFSESGVAADGQAGMYGLAYAGQGASSVPTFIGLKVESRIDAGPVALTPWISVAWRHEWSASRTQNAALIALPTAPFTTIGARAASDALQLKAGAQVQLTKTAALYATFEGELLTRNPVYAGKGGVRIGW